MVASKCRCKFQECPNGSPFGTCHLRPGGFCFTFFEEIQDEGIRTHSLEKRFGCFSPGAEALFQCKGYLTDHYVYKNISCCNSHNYCNDDLLTEINDGEIVFEEKFTLENFDLWIFLLLAGIIMILLTIAIFLSKYKYKKYLEKTKEFKKNGADSFFNNSQKLLLPAMAVTPTTKFSQDLSFEIDVTSGPFSSSMYKTLSFNNMMLGSNLSDSSGSSGVFVKYSSLMNTSQNSSNDTIDSNYVSNPPPYFLSSVASNTTSSFMSENTQQTILSSQKPNSLPPVNEDSITSGSGSGVPRLIQSTIARQIELKKFIGKGRFGRVWYGVRHCEEYAVKIFFSRHEASWKREVEIYEGIIMRHENIVTFFAADIISYNSCTQLWLVTEYHKLGSLFDYLNRKPIITVQQMFSLMRSIIFGLSHLHGEVNGTQGKPSIAHRDLKSKNILMKSEDCCCISDFASACTKNQNDVQILSGHNYRVGTNRYMAPEILNDSINQNNFEEYLYADIYSLGLIFWEIFNQLQMPNGTMNEYSKPYQEYVPDDPTIEDMREVVCKAKIRPSFNYDFMNNGNQVLFHLVNLIKECWSDNRYARLTSLRIKKTIIDIQRSYL